MKIRRFRKADAPSVFRIINECFLSLDVGLHNAHGKSLQISANKPDILIEKSKNITYFVAVENQDIIGICGYNRNKIHTLFVDIPHQKKGVGTKLLSFILKQAANQGIKTIKVWSTALAVRFYEKFGFIGNKKIQLPEGKNDIILIEMIKRL